MIDIKWTYFNDIIFLPEDLQKERMASLWFASIYRYGDNSKWIALTIQYQSKVIISILKYFKWDEENLTNVWSIMDHLFFVPKNYDKNIEYEMQEIADLFTHNLQLPSWHCWYPSQAELVDDIIHRLQKVMEQISQKE